MILPTPTTVTGTSTPARILAKSLVFFRRFLWQPDGVLDDIAGPSAGVLVGSADVNADEAKAKKQASPKEQHEPYPSHAAAEQAREQKPEKRNNRDAAANQENQKVKFPSAVLDLKNPKAKKDLKKEIIENILELSPEQYKQLMKIKDLLI